MPKLICTISCAVWTLFVPPISIFHIATAVSPVAYAARADDWMEARERLWKHALDAAGKPVGGLIREIFVAPQNAAPPSTEAPYSGTLVVSWRNPNDHTAPVYLSEEIGPPQILIQDERGNQVPGTAEARRIWGRDRDAGHRMPQVVQVAPGCATAEKVPLRKYFEISRPGRYVALVWGARPFPFEIRGPGNATLGKTTTHEAVPDPVVAFKRDDPFERQWEVALSVAGRPHGDLLLESIASPVEPGSAKLVVSQKNICASGNIRCESAYSYNDNTTEGVVVNSGLKAMDYCILLRDKTESPVPLKYAGRKWLAHHELCWDRALRPGEAIGFVFPLAQMFDLRPGEDYSALAVLRGSNENDPILAAPPVKICIPAQ